MKYLSTRDPSLRVEASQAIAQGISEEGGLFVPESLPDLRPEFPALAQLSYQELARRIFSLFLTDFSGEEIEACVADAYTSEKFGNSEPVKLVPLTDTGEKKYLLELWHGPTCAFKDMALQALPRFLTAAMKKAAPGKEAVILTATSGDTGKAALEGFRDVPGTRVAVFYPQNGVSPLQKLQMTTQEGGNVAVCGIDGTFDDAQAAVKRIFTDAALRERLSRRGLVFSSANSINWGRLLPQIVYYFWAYFELCRIGAVKPGEPFNAAVPTGNFGNILAAYYAGRMGLPLGRLICASNENRVLADFIRTGVYDRRRQFHATLSPSMDILVSSNLERLLFALSGEDGTVLSRWMGELSSSGTYDVGPVVREKVQKAFFGGSCGDGATRETIRELFRKEGYLCDPHTAVAVDVYRQYLRETGDTTVPTVIASTASPYKFPGAVLSALGIPAPGDEFQAAALLKQETGIAPPKQLMALRDKPVRFGESVPKEDADRFVLRFTGLEEG